MYGAVTLRQKRCWSECTEQPPCVRHALGVDVEDAIARADDSAGIVQRLSLVTLPYPIPLHLELVAEACGGHDRSRSLHAKFRAQMAGEADNRASPASPSCRRLPDWDGGGEPTAAHAQGWTVPGRLTAADTVAEHELCAHGSSSHWKAGVPSARH